MEAGDADTAQSQASSTRDLQELRMLIASGKLKMPRRIETVLQCLFDNPSDAAFGTTRSLAKRCGVSASTIVRLTGVLGFERFRDFRELFRNELRRSSHGNLR